MGPFGQVPLRRPALLVSRGRQERADPVSWSSRRRDWLTKVILEIVVVNGCLDIAQDGGAESCPAPFHPLQGDLFRLEYRLRFTRRNAGGRTIHVEPVIARGDRPLFEDDAVSMNCPDMALADDVLDQLQFLQFTL